MTPTYCRTTRLKVGACQCFRCREPEKANVSN